MTIEDTPLTMNAAAEAVGISRRHFERLLQRGEGPPTVRLGRRRLVRRLTLEGWLASREIGSGKAANS